MNSWATAGVEPVVGGVGLGEGLHLGLEATAVRRLALDQGVRARQRQADQRQQEPLLHGQVAAQLCDQVGSQMPAVVNVRRASPGIGAEFVEQLPQPPVTGPRNVDAVTHDCLHNLDSGSVPGCPTAGVNPVALARLHRSGEPLRGGGVVSLRRMPRAVRR